MSCNDCQELLSDYLDGLLELGERAQIESHLADCSACRVVRDDLLQIVHFSKQLPPLTPSNSVWVGIRRKIESEGRSVSWWSRIGQYQLKFSVAQLSAAAVALILSLSAIIVISRSRATTADLDTTRAAAPSIESRGLHAQSTKPAIEEIEQRINQLEASVERRRPVWNPELRTAFDRQMLYVDQSLVECRHGLSDNPYDDVCQELMLNAYREKVRLLEGFADY